jgi:hypothetical protein
MAAMPVKSPGRWRWWHGKLSQLPKTGIILVAMFRPDNGSTSKWLGAGGSGVAVAAFAQRWILNYVFLIFVLRSLTIVFGLFRIPILQ